MEVMLTTGAVRRAKFQSNRDWQETNTAFYRPDDALPRYIFQGFLLWGCQTSWGTRFQVVMTTADQVGICGLMNKAVSA